MWYQYWNSHFANAAKFLCFCTIPFIGPVCMRPHLTIYLRYGDWLYGLTILSAKRLPGSAAKGKRFLNVSADAHY
jgi:hypothetical protein